MAVLSKELLSGSTPGAPIKIAATATAGTLVHTAPSVTVGFDEVYLFLTNTDSAPRSVTIEFGGATDPDNLIVKTFVLPANSRPMLLLEGQLIRNGLTVRVFASTANVVLATGYVIRKTGA